VESEYMGVFREGRRGVRCSTILWV
jgi:hypothetical protein